MVAAEVAVVFWVIDFMLVGVVTEADADADANAVVDVLEIKSEACHAICTL